MNFKTTGILLIILILLGAYYYYFEVVQHGKKEKQKETAQQLFDFETDSVDAFAVKNQYGRFDFKKIQDEWRITNPVTTDAEENLVTSALNSLKGAKKDSEFPVKAQEKKNYGLQDRSIRVRLTLKNGKIDSLNIGDDTPVGSSVFASNIDTAVYTIPKNIKTSLDKKLFDWRNKNFLRFKRNDVHRMVIHRPRGNYEFEKVTDSQWRFSTIERPANSSTMNGILSKLETNKAKSFVDEDGTELKKYGLSDPRYQIDLYLGEEKGKKSLMISRKIDNKYYAKDELRKPIFEIDSALVSDIKKPEANFRDKKLINFDQNSIDRFVLEYHDTLLTCAKDTSGEWYLDEPERSGLKKTEITSFLSNIRNSTINEYVTDKPTNLRTYGLQNPSLNVQLFHGETRILEVKFGDLKKNNAYVMTDQYNSVYLVPKAQYTRLKLNRSKIVEKPVTLNDTTVTSEKN